MTNTDRTLGCSGITVSALGLGCWAIGGPLHRGDQELGWGEADDAVSTRAVHAGLDAGVTFFVVAAHRATAMALPRRRKAGPRDSTQMSSSVRLPKRCRWLRLGRRTRADARTITES